jgi:carboxylesterase type B
MSPFSASDAPGAIRLENDFRCGTAEAAKARALHNVPVWRYLFANNAPGSSKGATHGDEVGFVFGNERGPFMKLFQDAWVRFVKDPVDGLNRISTSSIAQLGWPKYDPKGM